MALQDFEVELSDGRVLDIRAESPEQAQQLAEQWLAGQQSQTAQPDQPAPEDEALAAGMRGAATAGAPGLGKLASLLFGSGQEQPEPAEEGSSPVAPGLGGAVNMLLNPRQAARSAGRTLQQGAALAEQGGIVGAERTAAGITNFAVTAAGKVLDMAGADGLENRILQWRDERFLPAESKARDDIARLRKNRLGEVDITLSAEQDDFFEKASEVAVQLAIGGTAVKASSLFATLIRSIGRGTVQGGILFDPEDPDQQLRNAAMGGIFGGLFGLVPATNAVRRNWLSRRAKGIEAEDAQRFLKMADEMGSGGSVGQATGNNLLVWLERRLPERSLKTLVDQSAAMKKRVDRMIQAMPNVRPGLVADVAGNAQRKAQALLRKRRSAAFKSGMRKIKSLHPNAQIDGSNMLRSMESVQAMVRRRGFSDLEMSAGFHRMLTRMRNLQKSGGMSVDDVNDFLVGLEGVSSGRMGSLFKNAEQGGVMDLQREFARRMRNALMEDLGSAVESGTFSKQAQGILRAIRDDYQAVTQEIKASRRTLLARMAKVAADDPDVEKKVAKLLADAPVDEQVRMVRTLRKMGAEGAAAIQGARAISLRSAVNAGLKAARDNPHASTNFDMPAFLRTLTRSPDELVGEGLFSAQQLKELRDAAFFVRKALNRPDGGRVTLGVQTITPEDVAASTVGMHHVFITRALVRALTVSRGAESLMFDKAGRKILQDLAEAPAKSPRMWTALAKLAVIHEEPQFYDDEDSL